MNLVIHIGACKTASTTLQKSLFSQHPQLEYLGEHGDEYPEYQKAFLDILHSDEAFCDRASMEAIVKDRISRSDKQTMIISSEDIVASPAFSQCVRRLCDLSPDASILLVIRNQISALQSYYAGHGAFLRPSPRPHYKRYVPMDAWLEYNFDVAPYGPITSYDYWRIIKCLEGLVGKERIKVLMFEDFINNRDLFCSQLGAVIGVDPKDVFSRLEASHERPRYSKRWHRYIRFRSHFFWEADFGRFMPKFVVQKFNRFLRAGPKLEVRFPAHWQARMQDYYAQGNRELADAYGLDLAKYNYPIVK